MSESEDAVKPLPNQKTRGSSEKSLFPSATSTSELSDSENDEGSEGEDEYQHRLSNLKIHFGVNDDACSLATFMGGSFMGPRGSRFSQRGSHFGPPSLIGQGSIFKSSSAWNLAEWSNDDQAEVKEGWLKKKFGIFGKSVWRKRYFVFSPHLGLLCLYHSKNDVAKDNASNVIPLDRVVSMPAHSTKETEFTINLGKISNPSKEAEPEPKPLQSITLDALATDLYSALATCQKAKLLPISEEEEKEFAKSGLKKYRDPSACLLGTPFPYFMKHSQLRTFGCRFIEKTYDQDRILFNSRKGGAKLYIIKSGKIRLSKLKRHSKEATLCVKEELDLLGSATILHGKHIVEAQVWDGPATVYEMSNKSYTDWKNVEMDRTIARRVKTIIGEDIAGDLKKLPFFEGVTEPRLRLLAGLIKIRCLAPGEVLFEEGSTDSRSLFVMYVGQVEASSTLRNSEKKVLKTFSHRGDFFGELALLLDIPRSATITAVSNTILFELSAKAYYHGRQFLNAKCIDSLESYCKLHAAELLRKYKDLSFFTDLPVDKFKRLAKECELRTYLPQDTIFKQGESGDSFYLIVHGECTAEVNDGENNSTTASVMGSGSHFGEIALVHTIPRTATVRVTSSGTSVLLKLTKERFDDFFFEAPETIAHFHAKTLGGDIPFKSFLHHPTGIKVFGEFCKLEFSEENITFWKACSKYRNLEEHKVVESYRAALIARVMEEKEQEEEEIGDKDSTFSNSSSNSSFDERKVDELKLTAISSVVSSSSNEEFCEIVTEEKLESLYQRLLQDVPEEASHQQKLHSFAGCLGLPEEGQILQAATNIFNEFTCESATTQVNLISDNRNYVQEVIKQACPERSTFDACVREIEKLMENDSFRRLKNHKLWAEFIESISLYQIQNQEKSAAKSQVRKRFSPIGPVKNKEVQVALPMATAVQQSQDQKSS